MFFSLVIIALWIFLMTLADGWDAMLITCVFLLLLIAPIYYWRWELILYKDKISFRRLFTRREYSYSQIQSVKEYDHTSSRSDGHYLMIYLSDGKKIQVLCNCMNFDKCRSELLRHMSIEFKRL